MNNTRGLLVVVSGPSGVGKGTTTITAECGGVKADCTVYITAK